MKLGLIGARLGHSYSRIIHEHFHRITGLEGTYDLIEIPDSDTLHFEINKLYEMGYQGFNVTIPYKVDVFKAADYRSEEAERIGAVNTVLFDNGKMKAFNTDYFGFGTTLEIEGINAGNKSWTVLGSGGSSKSVIAVLEDSGACQIKTASRTRTGDGFITYKQIDNGFGVVNTTPVGMYPEVEECILDDNVIKNFKVAIDLIYNPSKTVFLKKAENLGLRTANGLMMLVAQAVKAQEIWRKTSFPKDIILEIYNLMEDDND